MKFTFSGPGESIDRPKVTVEAPDEATARRLAMKKRWGEHPPREWGLDWHGRGLYLLEVQP